MPNTMESILMGKSSPDHSDTEDNNSKRSAVALEDTAKDNNKDTNKKNQPQSELTNRLKSLYKSPPGAAQQKKSTSEEPAKKRAKIQPQPSIQIIHEAVTPSDIIIVSVGKDDKMQEFQCSRTILSFTNKYFSGMIKSGMEESINNEVKFPDGDPEGWKIFCEEFASPDILGKLEHNHRSKMNKDNVEKLIPWFDKFEMHDHLKQCDKVISRSWHSWMKYGDFWVTSQLDVEAYQTRKKERETLFDEAFAIFQYADRYKLKDTLKIMGDGMASLMINVPLSTSDLFDKQVIKVNSQHLNGNVVFIRL